jgi:hypothetical protein
MGLFPYNYVAPPVLLLTNGLYDNQLAKNLIQVNQPLFFSTNRTSTPQHTRWFSTLKLKQAGIVGTTQ